MLTKVNLCTPSTVDTFGCTQPWPTESGEAELAVRIKAYNRHPRAARWMAAHTVSAINPRRGPTLQLAVGPHLIPNCQDTIRKLDYRQLPGQKDQSDLLMQMMSKALPMRCQIRALGPFLKRCIAESPPAKVLLSRICLCSLAGLYDHCKVAAPAELLFKLTAAFYYKPELGLKWFEKDTKRNRMLWRSMLQEYIVYATAEIPCLHTVLMKREDWALFHTRSIVNMNTFRQNFYDSGEVVVFNSNDAKLPHMMVAGPMFANILTQCANRVWSRELPKFYTKGVDLVRLQNKMLTVYTQAQGVVGLFDRLEMYKFKDSTMELLVSLVRRTHGSRHSDHSLKPLEDILRQVISQDLLGFAAFHQEMRIASTLLNSRIFALPTEIYKVQAQAVGRSALGGLCVSDPRVGNMVICSSCGKIKSSVAGGVTGNETVSVYPGSTQVAYSPENNMLVCNSGHSSRSTEYKSRRQFLEDKCSKPSSVPNLYSVTNFTERCRRTPVLHIHMIGNLVQHQDRMYTCCCHCGTVMVVQSLITDPCVSCKTHHKTMLCDTCGIKRKELVTWLVWSLDFAQVVQQRQLCLRCSTIAQSLKTAVPKWQDVKDAVTSKERIRLTRPLYHNKNKNKQARVNRSSGS